MTQISDWSNDLAFSESAIPAWKETLHEKFGPDLYEVQIRSEKETQLHYWDAFLVFKNKDPVRIEFKTRRMFYHKRYLEDNKRVIETQGNVELNKLGSSIFNSNIKFWALGFFDGKTIIDPIIFLREPVAKKVADLMSSKPWKYRQILNKSTNGLYRSAFVLVDEEFIKPFQIIKGGNY